MAGAPRHTASAQPHATQNSGLVERLSVPVRGMPANSNIYVTHHCFA